MALEVFCISAVPITIHIRKFEPIVRGGHRFSIETTVPPGIIFIHLLDKFSVSVINGDNGSIQVRKPLYLPGFVQYIAIGRKYGQKTNHHNFFPYLPTTIGIAHGNGMYSRSYSLKDIARLKSTIVQAKFVGSGILRVDGDRIV